MALKNVYKEVEKEKEVKDVVKYLIDEYKNELIGGEIDLTAAVSSDESDGVGVFTSLDDDGGDELYEQAKDEVIRAGKASTSYIQRKLGVGYSRAAKLIDLLEQKGVVGPGNGSKPREIIGGAGIATEPEPEQETEIENETEEETEIERVEHKNGDYL